MEKVFPLLPYGDESNFFTEARASTPALYMAKNRLQLNFQLESAADRTAFV